MSELIKYDEEDNERELLDIEIARYGDRDFLYQIWENDDELEVDVVGETYIDPSNEEHVEAAYIEGRIDHIEEDNYEWTIKPDVVDRTEVSIVSYDKGFEPEVDEPESLNQVAELERIMESAFNDKSMRH